MSNGSIPGSMDVSLSNRELEIIGLVAEGLTTKRSRLNSRSASAQWTTM